MQDRVPVNPGRVLITPENGSAAYYATMTRADNPTQEGTPLNKASLLKDATAAKFGLGTDAVPDDVFSFLGKYNQYWWKRRTTLSGYQPLIKSDLGRTYLTPDSGSNTFYYADTLTISDTGSISIANPTTLRVTYDSYTDAEQLRGKYFYASSNGYTSGGSLSGVTKNVVYYMPVDATFYTEYYDGDFYEYFVLSTSVYTVTTQYVTDTGEWVYLRSSERSTYPDSGVTDDYEYVFLGIPFDNSVNGIRIETGTYVGNGMYDSANPNSLTFSFKPKIVIVNNPAYQILHGNSYDSDTHSFGVLFDTLGGDYSNVFVTRNYSYKVKKSGNTISWYTTQSASVQLNSSGSTYHYIAIG